MTEIHPIVKQLLELPKHEQRSNEWYAERKQRLTASDVATALGMNPYSSRADLIYKKAGGPDNFKGNAATQYGQKWEDTAIQKYCNLYEDENYEFGLIPHPTIPFIGGSPDGITKKGILLEVKCPMRRTIEPGVVPSYYLPQILTCLECTGLEECHFIQFKPGPNEILDITVVKRDRVWWDNYLPVMDFFWKEVLHYRKIGHIKHPVHKKKADAAAAKEKKKAVAEKEVMPEQITQYLFKD